MIHETRLNRQIQKALFFVGMQFLGYISKDFSKQEWYDPTEDKKFILKIKEVTK